MKFKISILSIFLFSTPFFSQSFDLIPLGVFGGGDESNLSAYLIGEKGKNEFFALDAGTLRAGINKAIEKGHFRTTNEEVLKNYIKGYFISHGHLDHLSGLIINSPEDSPKNIYGTSATIDVLKDRYFTNNAWVNFANEGEQPQLKKYTYQRKDKEEIFDIENTKLKGQIFTLSHVNPQLSSAILVKNTKGESILYLGDTGADRIENGNFLQNLWLKISPLVQQKKIKAILIETSFDNSRDEKLLFGHLTPKLLNEELSHLAKISGLKNLSGLKVIITHLKPGGNQIEKIKAELVAENPNQVKFIFPIQGEKIEL